MDNKIECVATCAPLLQKKEEVQKSHYTTKICLIKMAVQYDQLYMMTSNPAKFEQNHLNSF